MRFALIGAAGYIAPRHMDAISRLGGELVAATDPHDSVGILDRYFPECQYFREFERFDRHLSRIDPVDYVVVCSPNYLHDAHVRFGLRLGANVICEKPVVLNERNLDELQRIEQEAPGKVYCILQMRLHEAAGAIHNQMSDGYHSVVVNYHVPRGHWYSYSWKGELSKSGGLATNIGSHLFDLAGSLFGDPVMIRKAYEAKTITVGVIKFSSATLEYSISVDLSGSKQRWIEVDGKLYDFTSGFTNLHQLSYQRILKGTGFTLEDARLGVRICEKVR